MQEFITEDPQEEREEDKIVLLEKNFVKEKRNDNVVKSRRVIIY